MSYKSRQKKRAIRAAQFKHRDTIAGRFYLTLVVQKTCCARCGGILNVGREMVYRHTPREALCLVCAERDPEIRARPSVAWELARRKAA
jgi:hypothetical protein